MYYTQTHREFSKKYTINITKLEIFNISSIEFTQA